MQHTNTVKLVNVYVNSKQELCATLTNSIKAVQCEDVLFLDFVDYDVMCAVYEEWCELAEAGEEGYTFVAA
jgi:hypothetical protein